MTQYYRKQVLNELIPFFQKDDRYLLLACDMGFGAIDKIAEAFPDRIVNMGIMEQATIGIAAGMYVSGLRPIVYSICNFLVFRALEQIRLNLVKQDLAVKLIGTGADDHFKHLGYSHTCGEQDTKIFNVIGLPVFDPYRANCPTFTLSEAVKKWIDPGAGPAYLRV
jgi:transketolase